MKILVTGGAGFIGSHLTEYLLDKGNSVWVVDNLSTGRYDNLRHLEGRKGFYFTVGTVFDKSLIEGIVRGVDYIYHLASAVGVKTVMDRPVQSIETIVRGTSILLFLANRYGVPVLITSSSEVYGKSGVPFSEDGHLSIGVTNKRRWLYGAAKAMDEFLAFAYHHETQLPVTCARLFNTAGPRQLGQYGMVIPTFIRQAQVGKDIIIHGDGTQTRCFTHVSDVVRGLVDLAGCARAVGRAVNIGSEEEVPINTLARRIMTLTQSQSRIVYVSYKDVYGDGFEDFSRRLPDLSLARSLISYQPQHSIDDILEDTISWTR